MFSSADTIVAVATPAGRGGLGVVRLSGGDAHRIACALIGRSRSLEPRHATFARVAAGGGPDRISRAVDQVVVTFFAAPHSFTGEDVVEISGHGSPLLLRSIVELAVSAGARLAEPGEFTLRAYLCGRMDLIQAEAVADLVDAVTPLQVRAAMDQLEGTLTSKIGAIDAALFDLIARLEASLDFPEAGFHFVTREETATGLADARRGLERLGREGRAGRVIREGSLVVIVGRPNAGKSSLFNALVGNARAIVSAEPGTTRDVLSEHVDIGGLAVTLVDTAGQRDARDAIEAEGVKRARQAQQVAAVVVLVVDGSAAVADDDRALAARRDVPYVVVASKADLPRAWGSTAFGDETLDVSVLTGRGLDELRRRIVLALTEREDWRDPPAISNVRHLGLVAAAAGAVQAAEDALGAGATEELVVAELAAARLALEEITGRRSSDDLLRHIFGRFCIGK